MPTRKAEAIWNGTIKEGSGNLSFGSGAYEGPYSFRSRFQEGEGTNPEELIGAAHAGCFAMALSGILTEEGLEPKSINAEAHVNLDGDQGAITTIELSVKASVPDIDEDTFKKHAQSAKENCPVSKALAGVDISVDAQLLS